MTTLLSFTSRVNEAGYEWIPGSDWNLLDGLRYDNLLEPRWLVRERWNPLGKQTPKILLRSVGKLTSQKTRPIRPTALDTGLFRNFAATEPTPEGIVEFANQYGSLWDRLEGEPFNEWEYEIRTMRFLVELWDAVVLKRTSVIAKAFPEFKPGKIRLPEAAIMNYEPFESLTAHAPVTQLMGPLGYEGAPMAAAKFFVVNAINCRVTKLGASVELEQAGADYRLSMQPRSLLGAIWLQFALSISGEKKYQACETCGHYMEVSSDASRADKRYCDAACRNRALRRRQKSVRELRTAGKSLREIVKLTGADLESVKKWVQPQE